MRSGQDPLFFLPVVKQMKPGFTAALYSLGGCLGNTGLPPQLQRQNVNIIQKYNIPPPLGPFLWGNRPQDSSLFGWGEDGGGNSCSRKTHIFRFHADVFTELLHSIGAQHMVWAGVLLEPGHALLRGEGLLWTQHMLPMERGSGREAGGTQEIIIIIIHIKDHR